MIAKRKVKYSNADILKYFLKKRHLPLKLAGKIFDAETSSFSLDECFRSAEVFKVADEAVKYMRFSKLEVRGELTESSYLSPIRKAAFELQFAEADARTEDYNQLLA